MQRKKPSIARRLVSGVLALGLLASPMTAWATEYPPSEVLDMTSFVEQLPSESQVAFVEEQQEQIPEEAQVASMPPPARVGGAGCPAGGELFRGF